MSTAGGTKATSGMRSTVDSHPHDDTCEAHPSDELVVPPGDQVVHLARLLHREPFQMVTAIQQPGHCLWRVRNPYLRRP